MTPVRPLTPLRSVRGDMASAQDVRFTRSERPGVYSYPTVGRAGLMGCLRQVTKLGSIFLLWKTIIYCSVFVRSAIAKKTDVPNNFPGGSVKKAAALLWSGKHRANRVHL